MYVYLCEYGFHVFYLGLEAPAHAGYPMPIYTVQIAYILRHTYIGAELYYTEKF